MLIELAIKRPAGPQTFKPSAGPDHTQRLTWASEGHGGGHLGGVLGNAAPDREVSIIRWKLRRAGSTDPSELIYQT